MLAVSATSAQETSGPRIEITGVNPVALPRVSVMVNAFDNFGQPLPDLVAENFRVVGELADRARVAEVVSFSDEKAVPITVVLAIDASSSMAGTPFQSARAAASAFVRAMAVDDPVAVLTFSTGTTLVHDFTTDRQSLLDSIARLGFGGETWLFDAALQAVERAATAANPRRAVILLSDGAHYDTTGSSTATSEDVRRAAVIDGVPVYTIGLGFGADRRYLTQLSEETNASFRESPTPVELDEIYTGLARLLRTQYDVTLDVDVPLDGRVWQLELEVDTPWGPVRARGNLRAPVPVPIFRFSSLPDPVVAPVELVAEVSADDGVAALTVALDDEEPVTLAEPPYSILIDPVSLSPATHRLQFSASDSDGDISSATLEFQVGALPPEVQLEPELAGEIEEAQHFTITVGGQTALAEARWRIDENAAATLDPALGFTIDPYTLAPGEHTLQLDVTNAGGGSASPDFPFIVPPLPLRFTIEGLQGGELLRDSAVVSVAVQNSQLPVTDIDYTLNDAPLADEDGRITLEAAQLRPGPATLIVSVRNAGGQTGTATLEFEVARLPLQIEVVGLTPGQIVDSDLELALDVSGQGSDFPLQVLLDGEPLSLQDGRASISVLALPPGEHTLVIRAQDEAGNITEATYPFTISPGPAQTATISARATATQVASQRFATAAAQATATQVVAERRATSLARSAAAAAGNRARIDATISARATATQVATQRFATAAAQATATQVVADRRATSLARSAAAAAGNRARIDATISARATATQVASQRFATAAAQATATQVVADRRATSLARSAAAAAGNRARIDATISARATATQVATQRFAAAQATATQVVAERRATSALRATAVAEQNRARVTSTSAARATATQVATQRFATAAAQATATQVVADRRATSALRATAVAEQNRARVTSTSAARATATQVATQRFATAAAQATATQVVAERRATAALRATAAAEQNRARVTSTSAARATATQVATQRIATAAAQATATQVVAERRATSALRATAVAEQNRARVTSTAAARATATQVATQRFATAAAQVVAERHATSALRATAVAEQNRARVTSTSAARATATQVATQRIATAAAQATATQVVAERRATSALRATAVAEQNRARVTSTVAARATATQVATQRIATAAAQAAATQVVAERRATSALRATAVAEQNRARVTSTVAARATATQVATQRFATAAAQATATQVVAERRATSALRATAVAEQNAPA